VKPDPNACEQGIRNVLADERLFLPTVDVAINLLRIAHRRIMPLMSASNNVSDNVADKRLPEK
jgi:hypothetical protein